MNSGVATDARATGGGLRDWAPVALMAALLLPSLALFPLFDVDEGAFSEATREMLASGDWLSTTLNGAPRFDKPILIYWLQAIAVRGFGFNEFALRLPSALAGLAWAGAILAYARPRFGAGTARYAAWIGATSLGVLAIAHAATADGLLNALLAATMFDLWRHLENGQPAPLRRMYAWIGLGILTKGPIAILVPFAVGFLACVLQRDAPWASRVRRWLRIVGDPVGWVIALALAAPWYGYALAVHGRAFIDGFIMKHNVERFSGTLEGHGGSILYYVVFAPVLLLPWTELLGAALRALRADLGQPATRYLWLWCGFVLAFFSLSGTKLPHYALYGLTPLFVLLARHRDDVRRPAAALAFPTLLLAIAPAAPWLLQAFAARDTATRARFYAELAAHALEAAPTTFYVAAFGALGIWIALLATQPAARLRLLAAGAGLCAFVLCYALAPWIGEVLNGPVKRAGFAARALPEPAVQWNIGAPSFSAYAGRSTPARAPEPGELALTRDDRLPADLDGYRILYREGPIVLLRREK